MGHDFFFFFLDALAEIMLAVINWISVEKTATQVSPIQVSYSSQGPGCSFGICAS